MRTFSLGACCAAMLWMTVFPRGSQALFGIGKSDQEAKPAATSQQAEGAAKPGAQEDAKDQDSGVQEAPQLPGMSNEMSSTVKFEVASPANAAGDSASPSSPSAGASRMPVTGAGTNLPTEVVIKGSESSGASRIRPVKQPLSIESDPYESIRPSLVPDESLLLAESPFTVSWRRTYPEFLYNARVVEPWRTVFSERAGIVFPVRDQLNEAMQRVIDPKEARDYKWKLTIADEDGRVFQSYEASKDPPPQIVWNGQNDQGDWIKAGRSYSAIYLFTDPSGAPHTKVGKPIQFRGIVHQEPDGFHITLDSTVLFGASKDGRAVQKGAGAHGLLRAAADLIKRRYNGIPLRVQVFASTNELADVQAALLQAYFQKELMMMPQHVTTESSHAQFSEQRVEIILLNR